MALWGRGGKPPQTEPEKLARMLFGAENPPGVKYISGSQDALGLMLPGINRLDYNGGYWPAAPPPGHGAGGADNEAEGEAGGTVRVRVRARVFGGARGGRRQGGAPYLLSDIHQHLPQPRHVCD